MKKIFLSVIVLTIAYLSQAQIRTGIVFGGNLSKQKVNVSEGSLFSNDNFKTYQAGVIGELQLTDNLYLQAEALYTRKGSTLKSSMGSDDTKVRIHYINAPVNLVYKMDVGFGKVFAGAGAYGGYGFGKKMYKDTDTWKREDLGLSFTAGFELHSGVFLSINSQKGLLDIYKADNVSIKNRSFSATLGVFF